MSLRMRRRCTMYHVLSSGSIYAGSADVRKARLWFLFFAMVLVLRRSSLTWLLAMSAAHLFACTSSLLPGLVWASAIQV